MSNQQPESAPNPRVDAAIARLEKLAKLHRLTWQRRRLEMFVCATQARRAAR